MKIREWTGKPRRENPINQTGYTRRESDSVSAKLEVYKFVVPIMVLIIGSLVTFELNKINDSLGKTNDKMDHMSGNIAAVTQQIMDDSNRIGRIEDRVYKRN